MKYPKWWTDSITIYNKWIDEDKIVHYKRTIIKNCFFKLASTIKEEQGDISSKRGFIVRIPQSGDYIDSLEWNETLEKFTLDIDDIIIKGEIEEEIDENTKGSRMNDLLDKYKKNAFTIKKVQENTKISLPHYLVTGE